MENNMESIARDGVNKSLWQDLRYSHVSETIANTEVVYDAIIVGGGITGITTALMLQRAGMQCMVIEAANIGFGTTGGTSAHLNTFFDATYPEITSDFGEDAAKLVAQAGKQAVSIIKGFVDEWSIDCDFEYKDGLLFSGNEKETKQLLEILEASRQAGVETIESADNGLPLLFEKCIRFADQGQFHPLKYVLGLAGQYRNLGGIILENTFVTGTDFKDDIHQISAGNLSFKGRNLVYATHVPPGINVMNFTCAPYRSYVIAAELLDDSYPKELHYDMQEPYHYFRTHHIGGKPYLVAGGEDHKTGHGEPEQAFENLENYVREHFKIAAVPYRWSSQYYVPVDGLPYIGQLPLSSERTFMATGFNGNGMIFGTIAGQMIAEEILGIENPYSDLFSPSRIKPLAGFSEFVKENADVTWHLIADRFSAKDLDSIAELKYGEGIVADLNGKKIAVYKDSAGEVTALSPVCTHAGCTVHFNSAEKSWDCPCHGGRFDTSGRVLTGPPRKDLEKINL